MKPAELVALLQDLYRERLSMRQRHVAGAERVTDYEFNNTYQYVIAREDTHLDWIRTAVRDLAGDLPPAPAALPVPDGGQAAIFEDDVRQAQAFVDRWRPRMATMTNARHQGMLKVILGETLEHKHFFEMARDGRDDLLGRRAPGSSTGGGVLATRWIE